MIALAAWVCLAAAGPQYVWPLDLPRVVTSSFGEYRPGRLHAGLDLRTGGIGLPVKAPADGQVSRVRCSPWGYGKALYLTFDDGASVVFGHLSGFAPAIAQDVREEQHRTRSYTADLSPPPAQFPVHAGEVVAFSGDTGAGPAHLHYELRDAGGCPINPRTLGITWPDAVRPRFLRVAVVPLDPDARVEGDLEPVVRATHATGDGTCRCDPVRACGRIGLAVEVQDPANNGENILGVRAATLAVEGARQFEVAYERLDYATAGSGAVCYHPFLLGTGRFLLLWRWPGNASASVAANARDGAVEVADTGAEVTLTAVDFLGNQADLSLRLDGGVPASLPAPATAPGGAGEWSMQCAGDWLVVTAAFPGPEPETPHLLTSDAAGERDTPFLRVTDRLFRAGYRPVPGPEPATIRCGHPRLAGEPRTVHAVAHGSEVECAAGDMQVRVPGQAPFGTLLMETAPGPVPADTPARAVSAAGILWPETAPLDAAVTVSFPAPTGVERPERVHVYRRGPSGWSCLETRRGQGRFEADAGALGTFALLEDTTPPVIADFVPANGATVPVPRPRIAARVSDGASGIADVSLTCNGEWLLAAYDPEAGCVAWERDADLPRGAAELVLTVTDQAGNVSMATRRITVAPGKEGGKARGGVRTPRAEKAGRGR